MAMGNGTHKLPVKADIRKAISKEAGDTVSVVLEDRVNQSLDFDTETLTRLAF